MDVLYKIEDLSLVEFQVKKVLGDREVFKRNEVERLFDEGVLRVQDGEAESFLKDLDVETLLAEQGSMEKDGAGFQFGEYPDF